MGHCGVEFGRRGFWWPCGLKFLASIQLLVAPWFRLLRLFSLTASVTRVGSGVVCLQPFGTRSHHPWLFKPENGGVEGLSGSSSSRGCRKMGPLAAAFEGWKSIEDLWLCFCFLNDFSQSGSSSSPSSYFFRSLLHCRFCQSLLNSTSSLLSFFHSSTRRRFRFSLLAVS